MPSSYKLLCSLLSNSGEHYHCDEDTYLCSNQFGNIWRLGRSRRSFRLVRRGRCRPNRPARTWFRRWRRRRRIACSSRRERGHQLKHGEMKVKTRWNEGENMGNMKVKHGEMKVKSLGKWRWKEGEIKVKTWGNKGETWGNEDENMKKMKMKTWGNIKVKTRLKHGEIWRWKQGENKVKTR